MSEEMRDFHPRRKSPALARMMAVKGLSGASSFDIRVFLQTKVRIADENARSCENFEQE